MMTRKKYVSEAIKIISKKIKPAKKVKQIKKISDLVNDVNAIGIKSGDVILVHSSLSSIGSVEEGAYTVIDALLEVIGPMGTLVVPTYPLKGTMLNICLRKDYIFDIKERPTNWGAIPFFFFNYEDVFRSVHPTHSISAKGKYAKMITESHHIGDKTYGENSPWAKIVELNGKVLGIGISLAPNTIYHHVEDIMGEKFPVNVKVNEFYNLKCKTDEDNYIEVKVQPLDPVVAKTRINKNPFIEKYFMSIYEGLGLLKVRKIGEALSWCVEAKMFCDVLIQLAELGITIYSTKKDLKKKKAYPFNRIKGKIKLNL
jgi:aminoglycoside 3-N-acetyltransferase